MELVVKRATRKMKRDIGKVFAGSFLKMITEIILNADDSYKRLEESGDYDSVGEIIITIHREARKVEIIDFAEGLNAADFQRIFAEYGAQHNFSESGHIRGLFGQGASDVLFFGAQTAKLGEIRSIKDEALHVCKFIVAEDQKIKIDTITKKKQVQSFMQKYEIEKNGTVVTFGLGQEVPIPQKNLLQEKIEQFYMLRYVLADPKRKVMLKHDKRKVVLNSKKYRLDQDDLLSSVKIAFNYDNTPFKGRLDIFQDPNLDAEERIMIIDEAKRVYDNTLFGLEETSGASRVKGVLILENLYERLTDYLNQENPLELLRDSRDGFDQRQSFTKMLFAACKKPLAEEIKRLNARYEPSQIALEKDKIIQSVLRRINAYYKKLKLEEIGNLEKGSEPPGEGLKFVREKIYITKGKTYDLKLLINPNLIPEEAGIHITAPINGALDLQTQTIQYQAKDIDGHGLVTKSVVLKGVKTTETALSLQATFEAYRAETAVNIVEEDIVYPENGLEFIPKESSVKPNKAVTLKLYVDISKFPLGSRINLTRTSKSELIPEETAWVVEASHLINDGLALIPIPFKGGALHEIHHFEALCQETTATAMVRIRQPKERDQGLEGLFSGLDAEYDTHAFWQSSYMKDSGKIKLNLAHPINKKLLNDVSIEAVKKADFTQAQYDYIFELVCYECARQIVLIKVEKHELQDDFATIVHETQVTKTELYRAITATQDESR